MTTPELRRAKNARDEFLTRPRRPITVVLDSVTQNYNIGAIFRLCDAFLVQQLVICGAKVELRKRRLVQAAQGTQHWVPWSERRRAGEAVTDAKALALGSWSPSRRRPVRVRNRSCRYFQRSWCRERSAAASRRKWWKRRMPLSRSRCLAWQTHSTSRPPANVASVLLTVSAGNAEFEVRSQDCECLLDRWRGGGLQWAASL